MRRLLSKRLPCQLTSRHCFFFVLLSIQTLRRCVRVRAAGDTDSQLREAMQPCLRASPADQGEAHLGSAKGSSLRSVVGCLVAQDTLAIGLSGVAVKLRVTQSLQVPSGDLSQDTRKSRAVRDVHESRVCVPHATYFLFHIEICSSVQDCPARGRRVLQQDCDQSS